MSGPTPPAGEKTSAAFVGLVMLMRELALGLLSQGQGAEARGLVDGIEALRGKTRGNLSPEETRFLEGVLFELHLAVVKGPPEPAGEAGPEGAGEEGAGTDPGESK